jgi:hypothetical protein
MDVSGRLLRSFAALPAGVHRPGAVSGTAPAP